MYFMGTPLKIGKDMMIMIVSKLFSFKWNLLAKGYVQSNYV